MLLIDIGNTRVKWAICRDGEWSNHSVAHHQDFTNVLSQSSLNWPNSINSAWVCNVGSETILHTVQNQLTKELGISVNQAQVKRSFAGLKNDYKNLSSLGVDRWVAAIGARSIQPSGDLIVIDVGTAVTIDYVSNNNVFEGGAILPGMKLMHDSLVGHTENISSELSDITQVLGKDTQECVNSGIGYGLVGGIERVINEMQKSITTKPNIVITGGGMQPVVTLSPLHFIKEPNLVLIGLAEIANKV